MIGHCSRGRQAFLAACSLPLAAAVDCYGAFVTVEPPESLGLRATPLLPIADRLSCPLLGLFGEEDRYPSPEQTAELEAVLTKHGKTFEFHTFEGAGHAFFAVDRVSYRPQVAVEGWKYIFTWFDRYLGA